MTDRDAKLVTYCVLLEPEQLARLRALSCATGVSMSEYVRRGIDAVLARRSPRKSFRLVVRHEDGRREILGLCAADAEDATNQWWARRGPLSDAAVLEQVTEVIE